MKLRRAALVSLVVALLSAVTTAGVWLAVDRGPASTAHPDGGRAGVGTAAPSHVQVLRAWDRARAEAWAEGDVAGLRRLYVPGSRTGRRDARMLEQYVDRGLVVSGLETQLISVRPLRHEADVLVLEVVDRVAAAEVVGAGTRRTLPSDRPSRRRIELRRDGDDDAWLVAEVGSSSGG